MRISVFLLIAGATALAACSESGDNSANASATKTAAATPKKKVPYCFFKPENSKGWAASRDKDGNIVVKGKGYLADSRYKADLGAPEIEGSTASVQLKMPQNDTGFASADGWWDIKKTIPNSSAIGTVDVECGAKTLASLTVK